MQHTFLQSTDKIRKVMETKTKLIAVRVVCEATKAGSNYILVVKCENELRIVRSGNGVWYRVLSQ